MGANGFKVPDRVYEQLIQRHGMDVNYKCVEKTFQNEFDRLQRRLGKKHRKRLHVLEELHNELRGMEDDALYTLAMQDCVALLRMLHVF